MNLMKCIFKSAIVALLAFSLVACSDDDDDPDYWVPPLSKTQGAYILNAGNWGSNDASIAYYDKETGECSSSNVFESMNKNLKLGDTGQDMLVTKDKIYISVTTSGIIYVTDLNCAVIDSVKSEKNGQLQEPRSFTTYGNYVYVTYYDGFVGRINRKTNKLDEKQVQVGKYPEELKIANGKIYVANSGQMYGDDVSVIDINTFSKIKDIKVAQNPTKVEVDRFGNIYVISNGNYGYIPGQDFTPSVLQRIDTENDAVAGDVIAEASYMKIAPQGDKLYFINSVYSSSSFEAKVYDVKTEKVLEGSFVDKDVTFSGSPSSISIDPQTGNIYLGTSMYLVEGDITIISGTDGKRIGYFKTDGLNPMGAFFVNN